MMGHPIYRPEDMQRVDRTAIERCGVPSLQLMETAARAVAAAAQRALQGRLGEVWVFCGCGNNGGDGLAAACFLLEMGHKVRCFLTAPDRPLSPDAGQMLRRLREAGGEAEAFCPPCVGAPDVVIDAMFGFSFHGALRGLPLEAARWIHASGAYVVACDLPSGVDPLTGAVASEAVRADCTVTMTAYKPGLLLAPGSEYAGEVEVVPIGIPPEALEAAQPVGYVTDRVLAKTCYPRRARNTHKGNYGKVLLLCGSRGYTGAAAMAVRAALRAGSGLAYLGVPESIYPILAAKLDAAVVFPLPEEAGQLSERAIPEILERLSAMDACLLGPGLGRSESVEAVCRAVLSAAQCPTVLDADGITALSRHMDMLQSTSAPLVLTPHDGEAARLGLHPEPEARLQAARAFAQEHGLTLLLKGYRTVVTDGEELYVNCTGNPGMAVGGSGDVLAGILVSLLGRGIAPVQAAAAAAWLHGAAGDCAAAHIGEAPLLPGDLTDALCEIIRELE